MAGPNTGMDTADMKKLLIVSKRQPVNCGVGMTKDGVVLLMDKIKTPRLLVKDLEKQFSDMKSPHWGTALVDTDADPRLVILTLNKAAPGMARRMKKTLKGTGFTKVEIHLEDGSVADKADEDDEEGAQRTAPAAAAPVGGAVTDGASPVMQEAGQGLAEFAGGATAQQGTAPAAAAPVGGAVTDGASHMMREVGQGLAELAGGATAQMRPAFNSGDKLPSPSYVNAQHQPEGLTGGPTASAGDSAFVTGGPAHEGLVGRVAALKDTAKKIYDAEAALESQAKGDKSMLDGARNMKAIGDGIVAIAKQVDEFDKSTNRPTIDKAEATLAYADKVIKFADAVNKVQSLNSKLDDFKQHPSDKTARAWAQGVGEVFDTAANYVPDDGFPGFVSDMWKGLLHAPKAYISAFITLMDLHYGLIDKEAGISGASVQTSDRSNLWGRTGWQGDLTGMFYKGFMQPKLKDNTSFQDFMLAHVKSEGSDLWDETVAVGKSLLLAAVARDVPDADPAKQSWIDYLGTF